LPTLSCSDEPSQFQPNGATDDAHEQERRKRDDEKHDELRRTGHADVQSVQPIQLPEILWWHADAAKWLMPAHSK